MKCLLALQTGMKQWHIFFMFPSCVLHLWESICNKNLECGKLQSTLNLRACVSLFGITSCLNSSLPLRGSMWLKNCDLHSHFLFLKLCFFWFFFSYFVVVLVGIFLLVICLVLCVVLFGFVFFLPPPFFFFKCCSSVSFGEE